MSYAAFVISRWSGRPGGGNITEFLRPLGRASLRNFGGIKMDYETLYRIIFNGITDAIDCMEKDGYAMAKETLIKAQQAAEDFFLSADEEME
jgi:hypothetical protein